MYWKRMNRIGVALIDFNGQDSDYCLIDDRLYNDLNKQYNFYYPKPGSNFSQITIQKEEFEAWKQMCSSLSLKDIQEKYHPFPKSEGKVTGTFIGYVIHLDKYINREVVTAYWFTDYETCVLLRSE